MSSISRGLRGRRPLRSAMRLKLIRRFARRRALVDVAVTADAQWRSECAAVRGAYHRWLAAGAGDKRVCLLRVHRRAGSRGARGRGYARLISRAGETLETALLHQLARSESACGGDRAMATTGLDDHRDQSARSSRPAARRRPRGEQHPDLSRRRARRGADLRCRQRIRRTVQPTTRRGPHSTQRSVGFGRSSTAGWRSTPPGTRRRSS